MLDSLIGTHHSFAALLLRIVLGIIFIAHGYPKLFKKELGPKGVSGFFKSLGIPAPLFFAYVVGIVEFFRRSASRHRVMDPPFWPADRHRYDCRDVESEIQKRLDIKGDGRRLGGRI